MDTMRHRAHSNLFRYKGVYKQCKIHEFIYKTEQLSQNLLLHV